MAGLESRVESITRQTTDTKLDKTDAMVRVQQEFVLPSDQAALEHLKAAGDNALRTPLVLWGVIRPVMSKRQDASYFLQLEWLDTGQQASGFYLQTKDEKTIKFDGTIDFNVQLFADLASENNPSRYNTFGFSITGSGVTPSIQLAENQYRDIIEQRKAVRVGLVLKDGTLTETGPLAYQDDFEPQ